MDRSPPPEASPTPPTAAPPASWRVRILDLSGGAEEGVTEEVGPFPAPEDAARFAACYVRDSIEHCRRPGLAPDAVREAWTQFGEDAEVVGPGECWRSAPFLDGFFARPASEAERDWRARDPRRPGRAKGGSA